MTTRLICPSCGYEHTLAQMREAARSKRAAKRSSLVDAYQAGASLAQVAERYTVSTTTVVNALKACGIARRKGKRFPERAVSRFPERDAKIAELYKSGSTLEEIGTRYSLTRERVRQILAKRFSDIGRDHKPRSKAYLERVARKRAEDSALAERLKADYRELGTIQATAKAHGVSYFKASAILHRYAADVGYRTQATLNRDTRLVHEYTTTDKTLAQLASEFGMPVPSLRSRLHRLGWTQARRKAERTAQQEAAA